MRLQNLFKRKNEPTDDGNKALFSTTAQVKRQQGGLIVVVSSAGGLRYLFNIAYGVGKAACDRLAQDMAVELDKHKITVISLWPGAVKTELIEKNVLSKPKDNMSSNELAMRSIFEDGESTEYSGIVLKHFASDPNRHSKTGKVWISGDLGAEYGLKDIDGRVIGSMRQIRTLMQLSGHTWLAAMTPAWLRIPGWMLSAMNSKL